MQPDDVLILVVGLIHRGPGQICHAFGTVAVCLWPRRRNVGIRRAECLY